MQRIPAIAMTKAICFIIMLCPFFICLSSVYASTEVVDQDGQSYGTIEISGGENSVTCKYDLENTEGCYCYGIWFGDSNGILAEKRIYPDGGVAMAGTVEFRELFPATEYKVRVELYTGWNDINYIGDVFTVNTGSESGINMYSTEASAAGAMQAFVLKGSCDTEYYIVKEADTAKSLTDAGNEMKRLVADHKYHDDYIYIKSGYFNFDISADKEGVIDGQRYIMYKLTGTTKAADFASYVALKKWAKKAAAKCRKKSRKGKLLWLNKYVMSSFKYSDDYMHASDMIKHRKGNCNAYAEAFMILCETCDIPCELVASSTHGWNLVKLGRYWYNVDTCWNDHYKRPKYIFLQKQSKTRKIKYHKATQYLSAGGNVAITDDWRQTHETN